MYYVQYVTTSYARLQTERYNSLDVARAALHSLTLIRWAEIVDEDGRVVEMRMGVREENAS